MKLHFYPDSMLTQVCKPVETPPTPEVIAEMQKLSKEHRGLAIAAPQCGLLQSFFCLSPSRPWWPYTDGSTGNQERAEIPLVWINPIITGRANVAMVRESCLSLPGVEALNQRFETVLVAFEDVFGENHVLRVVGLLATVVQHELDHLQGKLFIHQLKPFERQKVDRAINKLRKKKSHA